MGYPTPSPCFDCDRLFGVVSVDISRYIISTGVTINNSLPLISGADNRCGVFRVTVGSAQHQCQIQTTDCENTSIYFTSGGLSPNYSIRFDATTQNWNSVSWTPTYTTNTSLGSVTGNVFEFKHSTIAIVTYTLTLGA